MQTRLLIDGKLTGGEGVAESILDPATGAEIAKVPEASREQVDAAVRAAKAAFSGWSQTTPKDRAALLLKLADRIEGDAAALAELESRNAGKPLAAALNDEIPAIADVFRFFAGAARTQHGALAGEYLPGWSCLSRFRVRAWKSGGSVSTGRRRRILFRSTIRIKRSVLPLGERLRVLRMRSTGQPARDAPGL